MRSAPKWLAAALKRTNISTIPLVFSHQWREPTSPVFLYCIQEWDPTRVGYREPVPIWNRLQYNRYLPGPKCNADFGASFRCLSRLKTVARQIPREIGRASCREREE